MKNGHADCGRERLVCFQAFLHFGVVHCSQRQTRRESAVLSRGLLTLFYCGFRAGVKKTPPSYPFVRLVVRIGASAIDKEGSCWTVSGTKGRGVVHECDMMIMKISRGGSIAAWCSRRLRRAIGSEDNYLRNSALHVSSHTCSLRCPWDRITPRPQQTFEEA